MLLKKEHTKDIINNEELITGIDKNIPLIEKLVFSITPGIAIFYFTMSSTWLLFFFTDVIKINTAYVGTMFFAVSILNIVFTPLFGIYIDRQKTRWGKYKPWIFLVCVGSAVVGFLTFYNTNFGQAGKTIYATITYTIFCIFLSINTAPSMGMMAAMTKRQDDRMTISLGTSVWVIVFVVIASVASLPLINMLGNENQSMGFKKFMLIAMVINIVLAITIVKKAKERFVVEEHHARSDLQLVFKTLLRNKYALISMIYIFALNMFNASRAVIGIYYYKYYFNDVNMLVLVGGLTLLPIIAGTFLGSMITKKIGLKRTILSTVIVAIVTMVPIFLIPPTASGKILFIALTMTMSLFMGFALPAQGTMIPCAVDFSEWKFKTNSGGFFGSISGTIQSLSGAIAGGVIAWILEFVKYIPEVQQTSTALTGMRFAMSILPAVLLLPGLVLFWWDMTEKKHKEIIDEVNFSFDVK